MIGNLHSEKRKPLHVKAKKPIVDANPNPVDIGDSIPPLYEGQVEEVLLKGDEDLL